MRVLTWRQSVPIIYICFWEMGLKINQGGCNMAQVIEKVKRESKKALIKQIAEKTGRKAYEFDSLGRSNVETIKWVLELLDS